MNPKPTETRHLLVARCLHCPGLFCITEPCDEEERVKRDFAPDLLRHVYGRCPYCGREERLDRLKTLWCPVQIPVEEETE